MPNKGQKVQEPQTSLLIVHVTSGQTWLQWPVQLWNPKRMQYQPVPENKQCYYKAVYLMGLMGEGWKTHKLRINTWTFKSTRLVCKFWCIHSFHWHVQNATIPCHSQQLLPFLSVTHFSCHPSPQTILPSSLTSSCHLFLGLLLNLVVSKFIYNTLLGILFSSILCTCPNQCNIFNLTVSITIGFNTCLNFFIG